MSKPAAGIPTLTPFPPLTLPALRFARKWLVNLTLQVGCLENSHKSIFRPRQAAAGRLPGLCGQLAQHQQRAWGICSGPALCQQLGDESDGQQCAVWSPQMFRTTQQIVLWVKKVSR